MSSVGWHLEPDSEREILLPWLGGEANVVTRLAVLEYVAGLLRSQFRPALEDEHSGVFSRSRCDLRGRGEGRHPLPGSERPLGRDPPDGRIVVAGYNSRGLGIARYRANGTLDETFAEHGLLRPPTPRIFALAVALQPDGRIVAGGDYDIFRAGLARLRQNGTFDPTFGKDGWVSVDAGDGEQAWCGLAVQRPGRIVALAHVGPHEGGTAADWQGVLVRWLPDGSLDPAFGGDGLGETSIPDGLSIHGLASQDDGRLVVAGGLGESEAFLVLRFLG